MYTLQLRTTLTQIRRLESHHRAACDAGSPPALPHLWPLWQALCRALRTACIGARRLCRCTAKPPGWRPI